MPHGSIVVLGEYGEYFVGEVLCAFSTNNIPVLARFFMRWPEAADSKHVLVSVAFGVFGDVEFNHVLAGGMDSTCQDGVSFLGCRDFSQRWVRS